MESGTSMMGTLWPACNIWQSLELLHSAAHRSQLNQSHPLTLPL
jgi:hypothetical protein